MDEDVRIFLNSERMARASGEWDGSMLDPIEQDRARERAKASDHARWSSAALHAAGPDLPMGHAPLYAEPSLSMTKPTDVPMGPYASHLGLAHSRTLYPPTPPIVSYPGSDLPLPLGGPASRDYFPSSSTGKPAQVPRLVEDSDLVWPPRSRPRVQEMAPEPRDTRKRDKIRPFICLHCSRSFTRKHDLERHARVHSGNRPYVCRVCQKGFPRSDALRRHIRIERATHESYFASKDSDVLVISEREPPPQPGS